jgi:hypothetical protein
VCSVCGICSIILKTYNRSVKERVAGTGGRGKGGGELVVCVCAAFNRTLKQKVEIERAEAAEGK